MFKLRMFVRLLCTLLFLVILGCKPSVSELGADGIQEESQEDQDIVNDIKEMTDNLERYSNSPIDEAQHEPLDKQEENAVTEVVEEEPSIEETPISDYTFQVHDYRISLHDWDDEIDIYEILGDPNSETVEVLERAATFTGSYVRKMAYDGFSMELFSPSTNGESFWIMTMQADIPGYVTPEGIEVGDTLEALKEAYPDIPMALDGRTDPMNGAYEIIDEMSYEYLRFEVSDGVISTIRMYVLLP